MRIIITMWSILFASSVMAQAIVTQSTSQTNSDATTKVISPPPTAIAPSITSMNNDLCTVGISGAVQTQIIGISTGTATRDMNCERIKLAKNLYDMGMKVAAVSTLCQDERVFQAMMDAGTPCPIEGKIGAEAKELWDKNPERQPGKGNDKNKNIIGSIGSLFSNNTD